MYPFSRIVTSTYFDLFRHKHEFGPLFPFNFESDRLFFFLRFLIVFRVNTGTHSMNGEYSMMSIALPPWWHLLIVLVRKYDLFFFSKNIFLLSFFWFNSTLYFSSNDMHFNSMTYSVLFRDNPISPHYYPQFLIL
jgi:hypothetical protein